MTSQEEKKHGRLGGERWPARRRIWRQEEKDNQSGERR
jgi:hypothetical protein